MCPGQQTDRGPQQQGAATGGGTQGYYPGGKVAQLEDPHACSTHIQSL